LRCQALGSGSQNDKLPKKGGKRVFLPLHVDCGARHSGAGARASNSRRTRNKPTRSCSLHSKHPFVALLPLQLADHPLPSTAFQKTGFGTSGQGSGFDSRRYQIFPEVAGPLSLLSTTGEADIYARQVNFPLKMVVRPKHVWNNLNT
jgi:hypothetical protein